jgi:hypothetical protein
MADGGEAFNQWLGETLTGLDLDAEVYSEYATGILGEDDEPLEARVESVLEILGGACEADLTQFGLDLAREWSAWQAAENSQEADKAESAKLAREEAARLQREQELAELEESQQDKEEDLDDEEVARRAQLLSIYGFEPGGEEEGACGKAGGGAEEISGANQNRQAVDVLLRAKRDEAKALADKKKAKDKSDMANQKKKKEDTLTKRRAAAGQTGTKKPTQASIKAAAAKKKPNKSNRGENGSS